MSDYSFQEDFQLRAKKIEEIQSIGINPYPHKFDSPLSIQAICDLHDKDTSLANSHAAFNGEGPFFSVGGRLVLFRSMGKNAFARLTDATGQIQLMFNREISIAEGLTPESNITSLKFLEKKVDLGDVLGVSGVLFRTGTGELTLLVQKWSILCKALLSLPDKHTGIVDKGVRYRKRWLDLISNSDVQKTFFLRSRIFKLIRDFLDQKQFMEVETPILQNSYGGAEAEPFITHVNALEQDMFMRISLEISLKKILVGGALRIFEIGKVFRNEGIDRTHNPEFTMIEAYAAYWDYNDMMVLVEELIEFIAISLFGTAQLPYDHCPQAPNVILDFSAPWKRLSMKEALLEYMNIDVDTKSNEELRKMLREKTDLEVVNFENASRGMLIFFLFDELVEALLIQPHHIIDHPKETTPLCKLHRSSAQLQEGLVERFESFVVGQELCNAYTELNDPMVQRNFLEEQIKLKEEVPNKEVHPLDEEFLEAICQGMPPAGGVGIGLDRLVALFANVASIKDVLYFPLLKKHSE
ncbi:lysine--tRNA ligase [Candidatus Clavichlamydia salmonicola]|uniref:lysine--tRNA ligase n=1 Tax=Candidatus Clavichlamydia salmonicola TaxID=469812 RepID=UPI001890FB1F|nr:lysine--tRNA ligase [Candidatus Clavichlamydia salmonicola]